MEEAYLQIWKRAGEFDPGQSTPLAWMGGDRRRLAIPICRAGRNLTLAMAMAS
jgi:hypothetical protein